MNGSLTLREYQKNAIRTDRVHGNSTESLVVHLLGLAGEAGSLLSEYKKWIREGERYRPFTDQVSEELGDILWYLATIAERAGLDLQEVAEENLAKLADRWPSDTGNKALFGAADDSYDSTFPENEQLPRKIRILFNEVDKAGVKKLEIRDENGELLGDPLTDNSHSNDGYRFHDVFHFSNAINLGWSPVIRALLKKKRKSSPHIDEVEDGARAAITEEAISAAIFAHAKDHSFFEEIESVDYEMLRIIQLMTRPFEVRDRSLRDWEHSILEGFKIWRLMVANNGGVLVGDADSRTLRYEPAPFQLPGVEEIQSGKLIVFEGCDNVGKSTLVDEVMAALKGSNDAVALLSFPGKAENTIGSLVYDFHHSGAAKTTDQTSLQLMHIAAHIDCINNSIIPLLNDGHVVILDRYWWSTFVYGSVSGVDLNHLEIMIRLEKEVWGDCLPDCVFLIRRQEVESQPEVSGIAAAYERLADEEMHEYPVKHIHNEDSIENSVQEITKAIGEL